MAKRIVEQCHVLSMKDAVFNSGVIWAAGPYPQTAKGSASIDGHSFPLDIEIQAMQFGGHRYWALCPRCDRRCFKLYRPPNMNRYMCRQCHNLSYRSRQKRLSSWERTLNKIERLKAEASRPYQRTGRMLQILDEMAGLQAQFGGEYGEWVLKLESQIAD